MASADAKFGWLRLSSHHGGGTNFDSSWGNSKNDQLISETLVSLTLLAHGFD
jgi:hypothetical protein